MQVSVEATKGLEWKVTVKVPATRIEDEIGTRLQDLAKKVKLQGFRPGKVPLKVVKQHFGRDVRSEVIDEVMRTTLHDALVEKNLNPAGMPAIQPTEMAEGKDLEYIATFEVYPEFNVVGLDGCDIETISSTVSSADVDKMMQRLQKQHTEWHETTKGAALGDKVNIDFEGFMNDEKFSGGSAQGHELVLGSGSMIPGFEDPIIDAKAGDKVTANLTFPEKYHADLAGKPARFEITVNKVLEPKLPELDDALARKFDIAEGGIDKLKAEIMSNMSRELEMKLKETNKLAVFDKLIDKNPIDVPKALIDSEIEQLKKEFYHRISGGKPLPKGTNLPELPREMFESQAKKRVHLGLVVSEYVKEHELKVDQTKLQHFLELMAEAYQDPQEWISWYKSSKQRMNHVETAVLEEQVVEELLAQAKVTEKTVNYYDIIDTNARDMSDMDDDDHVHDEHCNHDHDHDHE